MSPRISKIKFRNLCIQEIPQILQLCAREGRHMGTESELRTWFEIDHEGFFVAVTEEGEIVGSCVGIRLSPFHGNVGMFVVKEEYRGCGIGTTIWSKAINHLGEHRNKGLSAVSKMFHIYVDKAHFNKIATWDVILFKLDGKRLLANLANFLETAKSAIEQNYETTLDQLEGEYDEVGKHHEEKHDDESNDRSDDSNDCSESDSFEEQSEDLNAIIENEELNSNFFKLRKNIEHLPDSYSPTGDLCNQVTNCLKDITHQENFQECANELKNSLTIGLGDLNRDISAWIKKRRSDSGRSKDARFPSFNQLIYSTAKPYDLNSFSNYSTIVFHGKSSPFISLPSLLNSDSFDLDSNSFRKNSKSFRSTSGKALRKASFNTLFDHQIDLRKDRITIVPYSDCWLAKLIKYDEQLNGYDRSQIVSLSVGEQNSETKIAITDDGQVVGYAIGKHSLQDVFLFAPLYAESSAIASDLIKNFVRSMSIEELAKGFVLKVPNCNHNAIELFRELGFEKQDYLVTRCFTHYVHQAATSRIFALQSTIFSSE